MSKPVPRFRGFYIAALLGLIVGGATAVLSAGMAVELGANTFFITYLALAFHQLPKLSVEHLKAHSDETDAPVAGIFLATAAVIVVCAVSLFLLINSGGDVDPVRLGLSMLSVVLSWFVVHTMGAMHYAYEYYGSAGERGSAKTRKLRGGLEFPGDEEPDGAAFLYFSYVLGMTAQTSDVNVTSRDMRKIVTVQSVFAFFFNTVIVAATVNLVVSLGQ